MEGEGVGGGGIENIRGPFDIPKNWQQVSNIKHHAQKNQDTIIEITDLAQMEKGTSKEFIRDVNLVPELSVFVASNLQLKDIERYCTKVSLFSILGIDPTYNIGSYYVTVTTYRHLLFETVEGANPVFLGPYLMHSGKEYNSYYRLPESMVKAIKTVDTFYCLAQMLKKMYTKFSEMFCLMHIIFCAICT